MYVGMRMWVCVSTSMFVHVFLCVHRFMYANMCMCECVYVYVKDCEIYNLSGGGKLVSLEVCR